MLNHYSIILTPRADKLLVFVDHVIATIQQYLNDHYSI